MLATPNQSLENSQSPLLVPNPAGEIKQDRRVCNQGSSFLMSYANEFATHAQLIVAEVQTKLVEFCSVPRCSLNNPPLLLNAALQSNPIPAAPCLEGRDLQKMG